MISISRIDNNIDNNLEKEIPINSRKSKKKRQINNNYINNKDYEENFIYSCRQKGNQRSDFIHPSGFGIAPLSQTSIQKFKQLNNKIINALDELVYWSSDEKDPRQRGYMLIADSPKWPAPSALTQEGIKFYDDGIAPETAEHIENIAINKACVSLHLTNEEKDSINELIIKTNEILLSFRKDLLDYEYNAVTLDNLVAIQPNLHNGAGYLPLHLDCPLNDGFGVVIVTVAITDDADIVLVDEGDAEPGSGLVVPEAGTAVRHVEAHDAQIGGVRATTSSFEHPAEVAHSVDHMSPLLNATVAVDTLIPPTLKAADLNDTTSPSSSSSFQRITCSMNLNRPSPPATVVPVASPTIAPSHQTCTLDSSAPSKRPRGRPSKAYLEAAATGAVAGDAGTIPVSSLRRSSRVSKPVSAAAECHSESSPTDAPSSPHTTNPTSSLSPTPSTSSSSGSGGSNSPRSSRSCWCYPLHEGEMYVLSGFARNKCAHGECA